MSNPTPTPPPTRGRRIQVRRSGVHGKGVFAVQAIAADETVMEYVGEVISWDEAQRRHPHDPLNPQHTFYFHIDGDHVIDALFGGNASRWINHSCEPNCESDERDGRIFIVALRDIAPGEELSYDYGLVLDERYTPKLKAEYACHCGSAHCRGTMLAPKRGVKLAAPKPATQAAGPGRTSGKAKAPADGQVKAKAKAKAKANTQAKGKASTQGAPNRQAQARAPSPASSQAKPSSKAEARSRKP
ncbi:SET domain-containing protein [Comamonas serinivorans]|uniref:SET domain-containing protein n=1 Tax=Comamonas serinivorans TaxID=1082851 RepID=UPI003AB097A9